MRLKLAGASSALASIRLADAAAALTALLAAATSLWTAPGSAGFCGAGLALVMLAIAVIDHRHLIIPDELTATAMLLAIVNAAITAPSIVDGVAAAVLRGVITMLFFLGLRWLYRQLRGREGLGLGDVKLALVAGAWLDWPLIPVAIEIAAVAALLAYAVWAIGGRSLDATSRLPFGLFFAPAIWLAWLIGATLFGA